MPGWVSRTLIFSCFGILAIKTETRPIISSETTMLSNHHHRKEEEMLVRHEQPFVYYTFKSTESHERIRHSENVANTTTIKHVSSSSSSVKMMRKVRSLDFTALYNNNKNHHSTTSSMASKFSQRQSFTLCQAQRYVVVVVGASDSLVMEVTLFGRARGGNSWSKGSRCFPGHVRESDRMLTREWNRIIGTFPRVTPHHC